ncbi:uncharacterized protein (TIGR02118 family) [Microbacterium sp. BE35]|uniref:EthD family reductase n=1 Tax=Microbacterium sp. BE35 TaxID=2817773 RepID=UPI0028587252|nr:EthD family reductase [Microbacterium sp. BE35]MDR7188174.1 uncharacterized protein (TIGR02118 family) [Microbacterium sp. BE35]
MSDNQVVVFVTYQGDADSWFDREYYLAKHMPLVQSAWGPYGLESAVAFFPPAVEAGTIVVAELRFRDEAAMEAAYKAPITPEVYCDTPKYTDIAPIRSRAYIF